MSTLGLVILTVASLKDYWHPLKLVAEMQLPSPQDQPLLLLSSNLWGPTRISLVSTMFTVAHSGMLLRAMVRTR